MTIMRFPLPTFCRGVTVSRYTDEELTKMAREVVDDLSADGLLGLQLVLTVSALTNLDPDIVTERIVEYASG